MAPVAESTLEEAFCGVRSQGQSSDYLGGSVRDQKCQSEADCV